MRSEKISLYLLTGFLGAGKTTLLKELLNILEDKKAGIIVNEFGKIGVDGPVIRKDGKELVEINNGSIFCTCLEGSFIEKVVAFSKLPIEYLFVEASGLSDPSNMESILNQVQRITNNAFEFKGLLCVVDAKNFIKLCQSLNTFQRQIKYGNLILINKTDLVDKKAVEEVRKKIREINPMAGVIETSYCKLGKDILERDFRDFRCPQPTASQNCPNNRPKIFTLKTSAVVNRQKMESFVRALGEETYRIKGFVQLEDGLVHLDCVQEEIDLRPSHLSRENTEIVIISKGREDLESLVKEKWDDLVGVPLTLEAE